MTLISNHSNNIFSNDFNGPVKKVGFHKFIHEKFKFKETSRTKEHPSIRAFKSKMQVAAESSKEIRDALKNAVGVTIDAVKARVGKCKLHFI